MIENDFQKQSMHHNSFRFENISSITNYAKKTRPIFHKYYLIEAKSKVKWLHYLLSQFYCMLSSCSKYWIYPFICGNCFSASFCLFSLHREILFSVPLSTLIDRSPDYCRHHAVCCSCCVWQLSQGTRPLDLKLSLHLGQWGLGFGCFLHLLW